MGFLKNLFAKKDCEICGGEIGLLGNKKLVDGDCCKDCAAKLSPRENRITRSPKQTASRTLCVTKMMVFLRLAQIS